MFKKLANYLNPVNRLGKKRSLLFPFTFSLAVCIISEILANEILHAPGIVGRYIILVNVASLIYFAFRDGVLAGILASVIPTLYYLYIIYTRHYTGEQLTAGITTTISLGILYIFIASIIGWLKQTIDTLLEREMRARVHAEEAITRLDAILEQLPVGVLITDNNGNLDIANRRFDVLSGKNVTKANINKLEDYIILKEDGTPMEDEDWPLSQALTTGKSTSRELFVRRPDGKKLYLQMSASLIRNKQKKVIAGAAIISDVTQQKEMEQRKDDFINMASHELRTPLTSVNIYMNVLRRHMEATKDQRGLMLQNKIDKQLFNLTELVYRLLDITNIEKGKLTLRKEKFFVKELSGEIVESLENLSKHKLILDWNTREVVNADRERIRQVLINLVSNAIKYSPEDSEIVIGSKKDDRYLIVSVTDSGMGIPKKDVTKVFERFYQVDEKRGKTYPGLGLGLHICKKIIEAHNGKIWVESAFGKGSTFYFSLPIYKKSINGRLARSFAAHEQA